jgi:hypothetical protein
VVEDSMGLKCTERGVGTRKKGDDENRILKPIQTTSYQIHDDIVVTRQAIYMLT